MNLLKLLVLCLFLSLNGCYKNHLYVQQEWIDVNFLASSRIGTPDPRLENPPCGQRLLIAWCFPQDLFDERLMLNITVRFWDTSELHEHLIVDTKQSHKALYFPQASAENRILTYRIVVTSEDGQIIETWNHPLWTPLIQIGDSN